VVELECRILGPLEAIRDGRTIRIPPQQRALLAFLALRLGKSVPVEELLAELWGDEVPRTAKASLQNAVSGLRKALARRAIETSPTGYRLNADVVAIDALRFESLVVAARSAEAPERAGLLREALAYWRGVPLSEFGVGWAEIARLEELRLTAVEDRMDADLSLGATAELVPELEALVTRHSLRERLWGQLMRALYLSGRQADALATYRRAHEAFVEELAIEPEPKLKELQLAILLQDPGLATREHEPEEILARAAPLLPTRTYAERAQSLLDQAIALWRLGERTRARALMEQAEAEAGRAGDVALATQARTGLAGHAWVRGEIRLSDYVSRTKEAVSAVEPTGNTRVLAKVVAVHATALLNAGRAVEAEIEYERAVELAIAAADPWQEGWSRNQLAFTWVRGPTSASEAVRRCDEQLAALEWGPPGPLGLWAAKGILHSQLGDASGAREFGTMAVDGAREGGLRFELAWTRWCFAEALEPFDPNEAETQLRLAYELLSAHEQDALDLASVCSELARLALRRNAVEEAGTFLAVARQHLRGDLVEEQVLFHRAAALVEEKSGDVTRAVEFARRAVAFARKADDIHRLAVTLETLTRLESSSGALKEAETLYGQKGDFLALARIRGATDPMNGTGGP
jgi:DNA-binding SARP family transcriptional activator